MVNNKPVLHRVFKQELVKEILASTELPRATSAGRPRAAAPECTKAQQWLEHALFGQDCRQREEGQHLKGTCCLFHQWEEIDVSTGNGHLGVWDDHPLSVWHPVSGSITHVPTFSLLIVGSGRRHIKTVPGIFPTYFWFYICLFYK